MRLVITLPLPPAALSPNARVHWATKASKAKKCRADGCLVARHVRNQANLKSPFARATVKAVFYKRTAVRSDGDNALASLKNYIDGIADAGIVRDDSAFIYLPVEFAKDKSDPRLELIIEGE